MDLFRPGPDGGPPDLLPPTFGGLTSAVSDTAYSLRLGWAAAMDDATTPDRIEYHVFIAQTAGAEDFAHASNVIVGAQTGPVGGLMPGTTYYVVVRAVDKAAHTETNTVEKMVTTRSPAPADVHFATDIMNILTNRACTELGCHNATSVQQGMDFTTMASAYAALVGHPSNERPELLRVKAGDSGQSYLIRKVLGSISANDGDAMPKPPFLPLVDDDIHLLREWIDQGAKNN